MSVAGVAIMLLLVMIASRGRDAMGMGMGTVGWLVLLCAVNGAPRGYPTYHARALPTPHTLSGQPIV